MSQSELRSITPVTLSELLGVDHGVDQVAHQGEADDREHGQPQVLDNPARHGFGA